MQMQVSWRFNIWKSL